MDIKNYEEMGYLITHWNEPNYYWMPYSEIEKIMKALWTDKAPRFIDLSKYGYGIESSSMIRWANKVVWIEWLIASEIIKIEDLDKREAVRKKLFSLKKAEKRIDYQVIQNVINTWYETRTLSTEEMNERLQMIW